ncbi:hypothetical protein E4V42_12230 [Clostridium estertheticum]|uniref:Uncharacterized protein n=1 Tax=Clostridium estertheticum TaxID=238834 RepID=A0A5N7J289_9CLOT|nr:DUF5677 domain-containing protein [Clostridium estertheticum]MPQ32195.1 hypothetical protein [Clostridium estertheticum]MPQ62855.1 hypothetical protein [Clostridium estertheticum]
MNDEEFLKDIMPNIEKYLIQNNRPIMIMQGYEWLREVITLYAKQHNLLEAAIVLMENGMNEEALILARSAMNNYFLIGYLLNDDVDRSRLKEYQTQPLISQKYLLVNMKDMLSGQFGIRMSEKGFKLSYTVSDLENKINQIESQIEAKGFSKKVRQLSIRKLAEKSDVQGFDFYAAYYGDASKFEHSDISSLDIYKTPIDEQTPVNCAFIMDLNKTDEKLKEKINEMFAISYLDSCIKITDVIVNKEPHLRVNYDANKLEEMLNKILAHVNK